MKDHGFLIFLNRVAKALNDDSSEQHPIDFSEIPSTNQINLKQIAGIPTQAN